MCRCPSCNAAWAKLLLAAAIVILVDTHGVQLSQESEEHRLKALCAQSDGEDERLYCEELTRISSRCNIERLDVSSTGALAGFHEYIRSGAPVILTGLQLETTTGDALQDALAKARNALRFKALAGLADPQTEIKVGQLVVDPVRKSITMREFSSNLRSATNASISGKDDPASLYQFPGSRLDVTAFGSLPRRLGTKNYSCEDNLCSLNMNAAGLGLPFHKHTTVLHEVLAGAKRFFVYKERSQFDDSFNLPGFAPASTTMRKWFTENYVMNWEWFDHRPTWECTIGPGDALLVPYSSIHGTLNFMPTASVVRSACEGAVAGLTHEVGGLCNGPRHPWYDRWKSSDFIPRTRPTEEERRSKRLVKILSQLWALQPGETYKKKYPLDDDEQQDQDHDDDNDDNDLRLQKEAKDFHDKAKHVAKSGDLKAAGKLFRAALKRTPDDYRIQGDYGYCLEISGDLLGAQKAYKKVLRLNPEMQKAKDFLQRVEAALQAQKSNA